MENTTTPRSIKISETMSHCGHLWNIYKALRTLKDPITEEFKIPSYRVFRLHYANWHRGNDTAMAELFVKLSNPMRLKLE